MDGWHRKEILMLVKTYPTPSQKYHETVCTAGITSEGKWIRLYPVQFRYMKPEQRFEKYTWVQIDTKKNSSDKRPESYKANVDTIQIIRKLDSKKDLEERKRYVLPLCKPSFDYIQDEYNRCRVSLGIFKPNKVHDLIIQPGEKEWTPKQQAILDQTSLLDTEMKSLEKVPWDFSFTFNCTDEKCTKDHTLKITDWEIFQAFRKFRHYYHSEKKALEKLKDKYMSFFTDSNRDSYLIVGTVHPWPTFITIGLFSYLKKEDKPANVIDNKSIEQFNFFHILDSTK